MTEVAGEDDGARVAAAEIECNRNALASENPRRILLPVLRRIAVADERHGAGIQRNAFDREACAAASDRRENAAPVRIAAVQRGFHKR